MSRSGRTSGDSRASAPRLSCPQAVSALALAVLGLGVVVGCGSSAPAGPAGGPVVGDVDDHCAGVTPIVINPASCDATPPADGGPAEENPVHYNAESDDDDCKYHVSFTATPVRVNQDVTFKVTLTDLAGAKGPVTKAPVDLAGTLDGAKAIANTDPTTTEGPLGTYTISPIRFPEAGRWVITYHLFEECKDLEDSPHGHASFYIDVP